jgi:hypothetical protein
MNAMPPLQHFVEYRRTYNHYEKWPEDIEKLFAFFDQNPEKTYSMRYISETTGVPLRTLYRWRTVHQTQAEWRPNTCYCSVNPRILSDDIEHQMANFLKDNFIAQARPINRQLLKREILAMVHSLVTEGALPDILLNFKCSYEFMEGFLKRNRLSFRKRRTRRRPNIDTNECDQYIRDLNFAYENFPPDHIVNADESSWKVAMCSGVTLAPIGAEIVNCYINGCDKADFTFIATIRADGSKLPLIALAKGTTAQCHRTFSNAGMDPNCIMHCKRGWCNETIVQQYLLWLRNEIPDGEICLIWDQYRSHMTQNITEMAGQLGVSLVFVPKGATGIYQPLDRYVFGALKAIGLAKFNRFIHENPGANLNKELSAAILLDAWSTLGERSVNRAWDFHLEEDSDGKDSDDEDDEFFLRDDGSEE